MTPNRSHFSNFLLDLNQDHDQQIFISQPQQQLYDASSSSSSSNNSTTYPIFFNSPRESGVFNFHEESQTSLYQPKANMYVSHGGSLCEHQTLKIHEIDYGLTLSLSKKLESETQNGSINNRSANWMPSKVKFTKKIIRSSDRSVMELPDHDHQTSIQKNEDDQMKQYTSINGDNICNKNNIPSTMINSYNPIRVCSDCNTTKTPLWRSGPRGPKSLCNACGIRQRKARRAAAMTAANAGVEATMFDAPKRPTIKKKLQHKGALQMNNNDSHLPIKKRCSFTCQDRSTSTKKIKKKSKLCFEDLALILSKNSAFERVFHQDEKEGAILLMALSYGLVHG